MGSKGEESAGDKERPNLGRSNAKWKGRKKPREHAAVTRWKVDPQIMSRSAGAHGASVLAQQACSIMPTVSIVLEEQKASAHES